MTDAHCHATGSGSRHFLCAVHPGDWERLLALDFDGRVFLGIHPWAAESATDADLVRLRDLLAAHPRTGVGEIGLDRMRARDIPPKAEDVFRRQLELAAEFRRPVQLHGAKCWGRVVAACAPYAGRIPAFVFHAFSRSGGLLDEMMRLGGYVTAGPALLNDHAVNYRELLRQVPADRLLVESDRTEGAEAIPSVEPLVDALAGLRGVPQAEMAACLAANANRLESV